MKNTISLKNKEFKKVYKSGKSVANHLLILYTLDDTSLLSNKLGICASKAVGNSIERHRATRLIREAYRLNEDKIKANKYIVVIARKNILEKKYNDVEGALIHLLKKMNLLND